MHKDYVGAYCGCKCFFYKINTFVFENIRRLVKYGEDFFF